MVVLRIVQALVIDNWPITLPVVLAIAAAYLLLPRVRGYRPLWGAALGGAAILLAGWLLVWSEAANVETILFYAFSGIAVVSGGLLVTQRNPVRAALSFALVVLATCGLFLLQAAPFLMAATTIVYAGAIVVTFLFVIMLAQQVGLSDADRRSREPLLSTIASFVLLGALLYCLQRTYDTRTLDALLARARQAADQDSAAAIARTLGDDHEFFQSFHEAVLAAGSSPDAQALVAEVTEIQSDWIEAEKDRDRDALKKELDRLVDIGIRVRSAYGLLQPHGHRVVSDFSIPPADLITPGENVAPLGRSLFTDYLLAVELAGTLLLVATIGAIAIAARGREGLR